MHIPNTAYTEYCIHRVLHTLSTTYTEYYIIPKFTVFHSQAVSHLSSLGGPCCTKLSIFPQLQVNQWIESQLPSGLPPNPLHPDRPLPHWPPPSTPLISIDHGLQVHLQTCSITASKYISKLAQSRPTRISLTSRDYDVVKQWSSHCIQRGFVRKSGSGSRSVWRVWEEMKGYLAMRIYLNCVDLWKLGNSVWDQERGMIDCISYNEMMYIYPGVFQIYTPCCSIHLCYPWISICPLPASPCQTEWRWWWETDFPTTMTSKCICKFSQLVSAGAPPITLEYSLEPDWLYVYI